MGEDGVDGVLLAVEGPGPQGLLEHLPGGGGVLDDGPVGAEAALQDGDAAVGAQGVVKGADDVPALQVEGLQEGTALLVETVFPAVLQVLAQGLAGDGQGVQVEEALDLLHHRRDAAGVVEILGGPVAGGADVQQIVHAPVETVEVVPVQLHAELLGDGRQVQQGVGGAGDGRVDDDGVLKGLPGDDLVGGQALPGQLDGLFSGLIGRFPQLLAGGGHQGAARQHQPQGLRHNLHGGRRAHEGARAAGGAGVLLVVGELLLGDFLPLEHGAVLADLFQGQQVRTRVHHAAADHDGGDVHPADPHEVGGHALVAAGDEDSAVKGGGVRVDFYHVGNHVPGGQRVVDAVVPLGLAVADVRCEVPGPGTPGVPDAPAGLLRQIQQMDAAGVAVSEGAFDDDLGS